MTQLERGLRRLALLVPLFAIAAAVMGFVPRGIALGHSGTTTFAGGYSVAGWALFQAFAAASVRATPTVRRGWTWFAGSVIFGGGGAVAWFVEHFTLSSESALWPAHVVMVCTGTAAALTTFALPAVLLFSEREPPPAPEARVVSPRA